MKARHEFATAEQYMDYLRMYYTGQALAGYLANPEMNIRVTSAEIISRDAVIQADTLVKYIDKYFPCQ